MVIGSPPIKKPAMMSKSANLEVVVFFFQPQGLEDDETDSTWLRISSIREFPENPKHSMYGFFEEYLQDTFTIKINHKCFHQHRSKGWCLNPEGLLNGTLYHPFGTLWKVQVGKYIPVPFEYLRAMASKKKNNQRCSRRELPTRGATIGRGLGWNSSQGEA